MAARIVEYRQKNGLFKKIEDLMNVRGLGEELPEAETAAHARRRQDGSQSASSSSNQTARSPANRGSGRSNDAARLRRPAGIPCSN